MRALLGADRNAGQPQHGEHVGVVPLERHREGEDVEIADERLGFDGDQRRSRGLERGNLALGGRKPLSHTMPSSALNRR